jgi:hypothetical protein
LRIHTQKQSRPTQEASPHLNRLTQRTIKKQAVSELPHAKAEDWKAEAANSATARFGHDFSRIPVYPETPMNLQVKLRVNAPGDIYEQEADRLSAQVTNMPEPHTQRTCACGSCQACRNKQTAHEHLQPKHVQPNDTAQISASPLTDKVLNSPGQPLDSSARGFMEQRFGHDFSRVVVHTSERAAVSAQAMKARAYTVGNNIVFGRGEFRPRTDDGIKLLAHELVHVIQQQGGASSTLRPDAPTAPALVQRATNENGGEEASASEEDLCDTKQWKTVRQATRHAKQAVRQALGALSHFNRDTAVQAAFSQSFGTGTEQAVADVKGKLERIEGLLTEPQERSGGKIHCAVEGSKECPGRMVAKIGLADELIICPRFFAEDRTDAGRASTLIHERAHSALLHSNTDIYDDQPIFPILGGVAGQSGEAGEVARQNPDSLAYFVRTIFGEKKSAFAPEPLTQPSYAWQGFGDAESPAEQKTVNEAITWVRQWLAWATGDLREFKAGAAAQGPLELERINRLVNQFHLERNPDHSVDTLRHVESLLTDDLEIVKVADGVGEKGVRWHDKGEAWKEAAIRKEFERAAEILKSKDHLEVSNLFISLGSTEARANALLDALSAQFETIRLVEFVRLNAAQHLHESGIKLDVSEESE